MATDLDGGDAEAAGLEHGADAAGRHALAEAAHHPAAHHHVLHGWPSHVSSILGSVTHSQGGEEASNELLERALASAGG